jgi:hypothetical protein
VAPRTGQRCDPVHGREADEPVDHARGRVGLAEVEAEDRGDEVELRDRHEAPVESADDQKRNGQPIELLHLCLPPVEVLFNEAAEYRSQRRLSSYCLDAV